jgi:predicted RNase H-like HicB family nuclease
MSKYLFVLESTKTGFSAYVPDLPGCVAAGESAEVVTRAIREAIEFHLEGMLDEGEQIPKPSTTAAYAEVALS